MDPLQLLILKNQYEILTRLEPDHQDFALALEAIDRGYMLEIEELVASAVTEPLDADSCQEVRDVLELYRNIQTSLHKAGADESSIKLARFPGFDGNEEAEHYSYCLYLLQEAGLWKGIETWDKHTYNSHLPMLDKYRRMLAAWHGEPHRYPYPVEYCEAILAAGEAD